ncbi:MAG: hypothetical protein VKP62_16935 [Candidatus Sericytochromatia bacterium]|nr:hypothetical protein [Candidatus Sericytochromatia bacterium]
MSDEKILSLRNPSDSASAEAALALFGHTMRTTINAALGFSEVLTQGHFGPISEVQREALLRISRNARTMVHVLDDYIEGRRERGEAFPHSETQEPAPPVE